MKSGNKRLTIVLSRIALLLSLLVIRPLLMASLNNGHFLIGDIIFIVNCTSAIFTIKAFVLLRRTMSKEMILAGGCLGILRAVSTWVGVYAVWSIPTGHHTLIQALLAPILIMSDRQSVWTRLNAYSIPIGMLFIIPIDAVMGISIGYVWSLLLLVLRIVGARATRYALVNWKPLAGQEAAPQGIAAVQTMTAALIAAVGWLHFISGENTGISPVGLVLSTGPIVGLALSEYATIRMITWLRTATSEAMLNAWLVMAPPVLLLVEAIAFDQEIRLSAAFGMLLIVGTSIRSIAHLLSREDRGLILKNQS